MRSVDVFWEQNPGKGFKIPLLKLDGKKVESEKCSKPLRIHQPNSCFKTLLLSQNVVVQPLESSIQIMKGSGKILVSSIRLLTSMEVDEIIIYGVIIVSDLIIVEKIVGNYMGNQQIGNQESNVMDEDTRPQ